MAKQAIILHEGSPGSREERLGRILDFFGVPWKCVCVAKQSGIGEDFRDSAAFGSVRAVALALGGRDGSDPPAGQPASYYAYADDEGDSCKGLASLFGSGCGRQVPTGTLPLIISRERPNLTGHMTGLNVSTQPRQPEGVFTGPNRAEQASWTAIISAGSDFVFVETRVKEACVFICASSEIIDIDEVLTGGFYDVKQHFCSVVPLVMFIRHVFRDVTWRPQELGACLIIDDPLLRKRYGFCDFSQMRELMHQHGFTTNIAFIPWNWRRTSSTGASFFREEADFFSVSIHGCDHTAGEFGVTSVSALEAAAHTAQTRMRMHRDRTGVRHDPIMVFPQGVFSAVCPEILQRNAFLAAVNTEINPTDSQNAQTRVRDVWDVAIMAYGAFPIFTRRYAAHGLENFAFDLLLGKPCLIVAHHDFFRDGGAQLLELVEKIRTLDSSIRWRSLGDVLRRACRRRTIGPHLEEIQMYGSELVVGNTANEPISLKILKRRGRDEVLSETLSDNQQLPYATSESHYSFEASVPAQSEARFDLVYHPRSIARPPLQTLRSKAAVATRRILSEFRDEYLMTNSLLSAPVHRMKRAFRKGA